MTNLLALPSIGTIHINTLSLLKKQLKFVKEKAKLLVKMVRLVGTNYKEHLGQRMQSGGCGHPVVSNSLHKPLWYKKPKQKGL